MDDAEPPFPTVDCPNCRATTIFDDEEPFAPGDRFWCSTCGHDLGDWTEVFSGFYGDAWPKLKASLTKA